MMKAMTMIMTMLLEAMIILSSERIDGLRAKTSRKLCAGAFHLSKIRKIPHAKWAAKPPTFGALFLSFGGVERARA